MQGWKSELDALRRGLPPDAAAMADLQRANAEFARKAMLGFGPDSKTPGSKSGQRIVYNLSSAHVPAVLHGRYLNAYDIKTRLGQRGPSRLRQQIDEAIGMASGTRLEPEQIYFGAVELNGSGIRYFGDFCLVLRPDGQPQMMLITNSYDVHRDPVRSRVVALDDASATQHNRIVALASWQGQWPTDAPEMAVLKLAPVIVSARRRLTTAAVAAGVLSDEDYIEVARNGSFGAQDIEEVRLSAADAAAEARIADRIFRGPTPTLAETLWRHRRRGAERAAALQRVSVRVVTTIGRDRG